MSEISARRKIRILRNADHQDIRCLRADKNRVLSWRTKDATNLHKNQHTDKTNATVQECNEEEIRTKRTSLKVTEETKFSGHQPSQVAGKRMNQHFENGDGSQIHSSIAFHLSDAAASTSRG
jgi:hypothetical protein